MTQGCFTDGKVWGVSGKILRITALPALARLVLTNPRSSLILVTELFVKSRYQVVSIADSCLWLRVTKKPSIQMEAIPCLGVSVTWWACKRSGGQGEMHVARTLGAWFFWPQRRLFRDIEKQKHVQSALRVNVAGPGTPRHYILDGSCVPPNMFRCWESPSQDSVPAQRGCKGFS